MNRSLRILITAGATREPIDAVRFISNRSSGKMGVALAQAAAAAGHDTTLLLGATTQEVTPPTDVRLVPYESTADLQRLLAKEFPGADVLIMAAAVCDYRPRQVVEGKLERREDGTYGLEMQATPDLVAQCAAHSCRDQRIIAFALEEPAKLIERAAAKLKRKAVDAIVANPLATMGGAEVEAVWIAADGATARPGPLTKTDFARWLIERIERS